MQHPKHALPDHDIHELIGKRWSPRAFDAARPVSRVELMKLFEAARWAPSSFNAQPWRFIVLDRETHRDAWQRTLATLTPRNQSWAAAAPVLVVIAVRTTFEQTGTPNMLAWYDAGQAVATMALQATAQGLGLRQVVEQRAYQARLACSRLAREQDRLSASEGGTRDGVT